MFDQQALPALTDRGTADIEATVNARRNLLSAFTRPTGVRKVLDLPAKEKEKTA